MSRTFTVQTSIGRNVKDVFDAIIDPDMIVRYFVDRTSGRLAPGERIVWFWDNWGDHPVVVDEVIPNERISLRLNSIDWDKSKANSFDVLVEFELEALGDSRTLLKISESGWPETLEGIKGSYDNCGGWQHMADCLKAWLEHGIDLRAVYTPDELAGERS